jgi:hypothetical protein
MSDTPCTVSAARDASVAKWHGIATMSTSTSSASEVASEATSATSPAETPPRGPRSSSMWMTAGRAPASGGGAGVAPHVGAPVSLSHAGTKFFSSPLILARFFFFFFFSWNFCILLVCVFYCVSSVGLFI